MKKELTINTLAVGNLKQHKKQYTVMIIGIVLAMVFSSSIVFMLSSLQSSVTKMRNERLGKQSIIWYSVTEDDVAKAKESKVIGKSGYAHVIGSLISANEHSKSRANVAWFDETALELMNPIIIDGRMPTSENEIAVEKMTLGELGISANVGDEITLDFKVQNGEKTFDESHPVTYKLVGILKTRVTRLPDFSDSNKLQPSAFICPDSVVELGGKEDLYCYANYFDGKENDSNLEKLLNFLDPTGQNRREVWSVIDFFSNSHVINTRDDSGRNMRNAILFLTVIIAVLMVASCLVIVNSFNSNLNERKKQIGMFRAIGATKRQIINIFAREALIIALISAPLSCLVSLGTVKMIITAMGDRFVFEPKIWMVVVSIIFCILCVMISAFIPLRSASRITPIQSIRNIENTRTLNKKKIKSKKEFDVSKLLAKRNLTFGKGKQAAVSIILIIAIVGSSYALSWYTYAAKHPQVIDYDYDLTVRRIDSYAVNYKKDNDGFTEQDKRFIANNKYIGESNGRKVAAANLLIPTDTSDYRKMIFGNYQRIPDFPETDINASNYQKALLSQKYPDGNRDKVKELFNVDDCTPITMVSYDGKFKEIFNEYVFDGEINVDKINSGEEVILCIPKNVSVFHESLGDQGSGLTYYYNDEETERDYVFKSECDFHAGDEIEIGVVIAAAPDNSNVSSLADSSVPEETTLMRKKVKIGAIAYSTNDDLHITSLLITSTSLMNSMVPNLKYDELHFNLNTPCNNEVDEYVMDDIEKISSVVSTSESVSNYGLAQEQKEFSNGILTAVLSVAVLFFVISISIINNNVTSDIRNSKSKLGTLRAVGADEKAIVKSYIHQLLSMLLWGSGIGLGAFFSSYYIARFIHFLYHNDPRHFPADWTMICNPTAAIIFIALAFIICSLNLWFKIRKEMKNSIVENIREL